MSIGFSAEEMRDVVHQYLALPYGCRGRWLADRGIKKSQFNRWRSMVLAGDVERGLVPRAGLLVSAEEASEVGRLARRLREVEAESAAKDKRLAQAEAEVARHQAAVAALGKAIGLLQPLRDSEQPSPGLGTGNNPSGQLPPSS
jgi:hypothetical protein